MIIIIKVNEISIVKDKEISKYAETCISRLFYREPDAVIPHVLVLRMDDWSDPLVLLTKRPFVNFL